MKKILLIATAGACLLLNSGCATAIWGNHRMNTMLERPGEYGLKVTPFDRDVGGPAVSVDLLDLYGNFGGEMAVANVIDIGTGILGYQLGKRNGWWGGDKKDSASQLELDTIPNVGGHVVSIPGNNNYIDLSTGHNTTDNHSGVPPAAETTPGAQ